MIWPGEEQAWGLLTELDSKDIQTRSSVSFDCKISSYVVMCFGQEISVSPENRNISSHTPLGEFLVKDLGRFSRISILRYLIHAKDRPLLGNLMKPSDLPGGQIFLRGSHVLPLNQIAERFDNKAEDFLIKAKELGGCQMDYGDISVMLYPFPRLPVAIILWTGDKNFSANCNLLFDSSCTSHAPIDILWATARISVEMILR